MKVIKKIEELRNILRNTTDEKGFVPTMGFLHKGHISLVEKSVNENKITVCSIFVNPIQFGKNEDLDKYPRDIENDIVMLEKAGCDIVFIPDVKDIYNDQRVFVTIRDYADCLCGEKRPGHFEGVLTVVCKLFNIVQPDRAYFGEKDYQQFIILKKMNSDLNFPIEIKMGDIIREQDGLAMSSRNVYLSEYERDQAVILYKTLQFVRKNSYPGQDTEKLHKITLDFVRSNSDQNTVKIDYIDFRDGNTLYEDRKISDQTRIFMAFFVGKTRLIDNGQVLKSE